MMRLTVMYTAPSDSDAFEQHYNEVHMPLARAIPGLVRAEAAKVVATPDGSPPPYYRIAQLDFEDRAAMQAGLASDEGRRSGKDIAQLCARSGATATMLIAEVD